VVYELGLERAIEIGALTPYDYHPVVVELEDRELETYLDLSMKIGVLAGQSDGPLNEDDPMLEALLIKRARILSLARGKLGRLGALMEPRRTSSHNLFYCGDGHALRLLGSPAARTRSSSATTARSCIGPRPRASAMAVPRA